MNLSQFLLTIAVAAVPSSVIAILVFLLNRKGANKKLDLEVDSVDANKAETFSKIYQDLLNRANAAVAEAEQTKADLIGRVETLEGKAKEGVAELNKTNGKLDTVRRLFQRYVARVGIPMTPEEQEVFESTKPSVNPRKVAT